jgi:hypothetical protein
MGRQFGSGNSISVKPQARGNGLEFTLTVPETGTTLTIVFAQKQIYHHGPGRANPPGGGPDIHPIPNRCGTGRNKAFCTLNLHHTDPTGSQGLMGFHVAEGGYHNTSFF